MLDFCQVEFLEWGLLVWKIILGQPPGEVFAGDLGEPLQVAVGWIRGAPIPFFRPEPLVYELRVKWPRAGEVYLSPPLIIEHLLNLFRYVHKNTLTGITA